VNAAGGLIFVFILFAAFTPAILALIWLRAGGRGKKERWSDIAYVFVFGAVLAILIAVVLELLASMFLGTEIIREYTFLARNPNILTFLLVVVIAPLTEEFAKQLGVMRFSRFLWRPRNGLVFGAAAGLGFAATENLLYEGAAFVAGGVPAFVAVAILRSFSSVLMHASASSVAGYGIARSKTYGEQWWPYFLLAVTMHASFNLFASFGELFSSSLGPTAQIIGVLFSFALVLVSITVIRARIGSYSP